MADMECEHCGGSEFYKEAGFFFCKGCQVQSQEVQEYVFDEFAETRARAKKVQSEKSEKVDNKITSWECYNYILLGLTEELINLGASKKLKTVVRILWLRYLEKMRVFKLGEDRLPKLQAVCSGIDGEIVYGKLAKMKRKRRKSSSSEGNSATLNSSSMKQERVKRKRALVKAQYEDFSQKSQATSSLQNETLTSLQTGSEKSSKNAVPISYNIYASRELKRITGSKSHWRKHCVDFEKQLKCHKISYRQISHKYRRSPYILSLNKIYSILYLALLILKEKIQLSDIFRFIKEGHLSFNCYSHMFPDHFTDKTLNFRNFKKNSVFANTPLRLITSEMSTFLEVDYYVSCPDLIELCERYCKELNLPSGICYCAKNLISRVELNMSYRKRFNKVPNYEGRVLSIILFVIKLLFGLDDVTEFYLGQYADVFNGNGLVKTKLFNIIEWLKYIEYRDIIMTQEHFPTSFSKDLENINLPLGVLAKKEYPPEKKYSANKDTYKQFLMKLKDNLHEPQSIDFPVTLTPFLDYVKIIRRRKHLDILSNDFTNDNLDHILKPSKFLEILNQKGHLEMVHGGANEDWILEEISNVEQDRKRDLREERKLVTVKLSFGAPKSSQTQEETKIDAQKIKDNFRVANEGRFSQNMKRLNGKDPSFVSAVKFSKSRKSLDVTEEYPRHYNPYERFWMRTKLRLEFLNQKESKKFLDTFPHNFRLVFQECQRIAQQNEHDMLVEYQMTELRLVHLANFGKKTREQELIKNRLIANYLEKSAHLW